MEEILQFIMSLGLEGIIMSIITCVVVAILKLPFKALTNKIKNEKCRKVVNVFIILLAFGVGIGAKWLFETYLGNGNMDNLIIGGLANGAGATAIYAVIDQLLGNKSPKTIGVANSVISATQNVLNDGKVDGADNTTVKSAVEDLYNSL
jgi:hypothetical protein